MQRLKTTNADLPDLVDAIAFRSLNGTVLQLLNRGTEAESVTVCVGDSTAVVDLPATSITTAMW